MKKFQLIKILCAILLAITASGCSANTEDKGKVQEPEDSIISGEDRDKDDEDKIDNESGEPGAPAIAIIKTDSYEKLEITDWLDSDTVVVSKENEALEKMKLAELSDSYPRSLYRFNLNTGEYTLLTEHQEFNLGGAKLSPDKKNLLYYGNSLGDLSYYVLNLESLRSFGITSEEVGNVGSADWADKDTVIGAGYMNGAYYADTEGTVTVLEELDQNAVYIIKRIKDTVYFNTADNPTLMAFHASGKEITSTNLNDVFGVYPAPDENQMLVLQYSGQKQLLLLCDRDGSNAKIIAEGAELGGISWAAGRQMIAYRLKEDGGSAVAGLYVYDIVTGESTLAAEDIGDVTTCWSPSGEKLAYTQWDGKQYNSSIISFEYSLKK